MSSLVSCDVRDGVATLAMDDGKLDVVSPRMLRDVGHALDQAENEQAVVVLTGRDETFSVGFDLQVLKTGVLDALNMLTGPGGTPGGGPVPRRLERRCENRRQDRRLLDAAVAKKSSSRSLVQRPPSSVRVSALVRRRDLWYQLALY